MKTKLFCTALALLTSGFISTSFAQTASSRGRDNQTAQQHRVKKEPKNDELNKGEARRQEAWDANEQRSETKKMTKSNKAAARAEKRKLHKEQKASNKAARKDNKEKTEL